MAPKLHRARYVTVGGHTPAARAAAVREYRYAWGRRPFIVLRHEGGWIACNLACLWRVLAQR